MHVTEQGRPPSTQQHQKLGVSSIERIVFCIATIEDESNGSIPFDSNNIISILSSFDTTVSSTNNVLNCGVCSSNSIFSSGLCFASSLVSSICGVLCFSSNSISTGSSIGHVSESFFCSGLSSFSRFLSVLSLTLSSTSITSGFFYG